MKKLIVLILGLLLALTSLAQDQVIDGNLTTTKEVSVGQDNGVWGLGTRLHLRGTNYSSDPIWLAKYTLKREYTDLRINIGDAYDASDRLVVGTTNWETGFFREWFVVRSDGRVGIGVEQPNSTLDVNGTIRAKEVKIEATGWADFVFSPDYQLKSLSEVEDHIARYKCLPDIPSETEVVESGVNISEIQIKLLQKIEELTLYMIEYDKKYNELKIVNQELENRIKKLEKQL